MATMVERLPAGFQSDLVLSKAVDSGLGSVSSGIQAASQASPAEIGDLVESFAACFPPIGTSPEALKTFSDAGMIQSPDSYLNNARQLSGEDGLTGFSDLVSMNQVADKLSDPKFNHQKSLQDFSTALSNLELPGDPNKPLQPGDANARKALDTESHAFIIEGGREQEEAIASKVIDTESQAFIIDWSQPQDGAQVGKIRDTESQAFVIDGSKPTDAGTQKVSGESNAFVIYGKPESESKSFVINWESRGAVIGSSTPSQDSSIVGAVRDLQSTLKGIVNLTRQTERE